jgi:4-hydroxybenzoate polyprenyltransferase
MLKLVAQAIRLPNLVLVALTMYCIRLFLMDGQGVLSAWQFGLLVGVMCIITASGYIINDVYDYLIDRLNKPDRIWMNKLPETAPMQWYYKTVLVGSIPALFLAISADKWWLFGLYPVFVGLLWWYSAYLKKTVLWGNLTVAFFCTGVVALVVYAHQLTIQSIGDQLAARQYVLVFYIVFAFVSTLYRELVKDLEDVGGDIQYNCKTLPIVYGDQVARWIAIFVALCLSVSVCMYSLIISTLSHQVFMLLIAVCTAFSAGMLYRSDSPTHYHHISTFIKVIMLFGLLYLPFQYYCP